MMWHLQLLIDWASAMLAQDAVLNAVFAVLTLSTAFGRSPRVFVVLTALVHLILMIT
jgi:hypothetical protein